MAKARHRGSAQSRDHPIHIGRRQHVGLPDRDDLAQRHGPSHGDTGAVDFAADEVPGDRDGGGEAVGTAEPDDLGPGTAYGRTSAMSPCVVREARLAGGDVSTVRRRSGRPHMMEVAMSGRRSFAREFSRQAGVGLLIVLGVVLVLLVTGSPTPWALIRACLIGGGSGVLIGAGLSSARRTRRDRQHLTG